MADSSSFLIDCGSTVEQPWKRYRCFGIGAIARFVSAYSQDDDFLALGNWDFHHLTKKAGAYNLYCDLH